MAIVPVVVVQHPAPDKENQQSYEVQEKRDATEPQEARPITLNYPQFVKYQQYVRERYNEKELDPDLYWDSALVTLSPIEFDDKDDDDQDRYEYARDATYEVLARGDHLIL